MPGKSVVITAASINEEHRLAQDSASSAVKHAIKCGELLTKKKADMKHGEWKPWVEANCKFSYASAKLYMKAAKQKANALAFSALRDLYGPDRKSVVTTYSGKGDWRTPGRFVEASRAAMGGIDLDPASSEQANETVRAARFYTEQEDGLSQAWHGRVFLNPPYDKQSVAAFSRKLLDELRAGHLDAAILLTNNSTDTSWWQAAARECTAICFTAGRINFDDDSGKTGNTNGQTFIYFGDNINNFRKAFDGIGWVAING